MKYKLIANTYNSDKVDWESTKQLYAKHINLKYEPDCLEYKDYNIQVKKNREHSKDWKNRGKKEDIKTKKMQKYEERDKEIKCPILQCNNLFKKSSENIKKIFEKVQQKLGFATSKKPNMSEIKDIKCPIEIIVLYYFYEFMNNPFETTEINDLLRIVHYWGENFTKHNFTKHDEKKNYYCECDKLFKHTKVKSDKPELVDFYKKLDIDEKYEKFEKDNKFEYEFKIYNDSKYFSNKNKDSKNEYITIIDSIFIDYKNESLNKDTLRTKTKQKHVVLEHIQEIDELNFDRTAVELIFKDAFMNLFEKTDTKIVLFSLNVAPLYFEFNITDEDHEIMCNFIREEAMDVIKSNNKLYVNWIINIAKNNEIDEKSLKEFTNQEYSICDDNKILKNLFYVFDNKEILDEKADVIKRFPDYLKNIGYNDIFKSKNIIEFNKIYKENGKLSVKSIKAVLLNDLNKQSENKFKLS